jgi:hypothetical protein
MLGANAPPVGHFARHARHRVHCGIRNAAQESFKDTETSFSGIVLSIANRAKLPALPRSATLNGLFERQQNPWALVPALGAVSRDVSPQQ